MRLSKWAIILMLASSGVIASDIKIVGTIDKSIVAPSFTSSNKFKSADKQVTLLKIQLSDRLQKKIQNNLTISPELKVNKFYQGAPKSVQLGMNNVPVLDQGHHGSCAMYAVTAALDAETNNGKYTSQLCLLELGTFLEKNAHIPSGWDGYTIQTILNEISIFGLISKNQQQKNGCGGLTEYPLKDIDTSSIEMTPSEYHQLSSPLDENIGWSSVIDQYTMEDNSDINQKVKAVKLALDAKNRLSFGVILADLNLGEVGAVGKFHVKNDSWLLTDKIMNDTIDYIDGINPGFQYAGHAMVITGYDDNAVAIDDLGKRHTGLFTLRNSWGKDAGDQGNYYMSYDYFAVFSMEAMRIRTTK